MANNTVSKLVDMLKTGKWKTCFNCNGAGQVSTFSGSGADFDFDGPGECRTCDGGGMVFEYSNGTTVMYPGGPFVG